MIEHLLVLTCSLFLLLKGATAASTYAVRLAKNFHLSTYTVGFIVIAIVSILPETFISIQSAFAGIPAFGLGTLFGSNIADLTIVFAGLIFLSGRNLRVETTILKHNRVYPLLLLLPVILGLDGAYSRFEGAALVLVGGAFYLLALKNGSGSHHQTRPEPYLKNILALLASMVVLLIGSYFTVSSASRLAEDLGISPILIGMLIVGVGTTLPEFVFSLKSVGKHKDALAVGDILGTVLADATVVVGILALIAPFTFPRTLVYVTGGFMVAASFALLAGLNTGRTLTKREALGLTALWFCFVLVELFVGTA